MQKKQSGNAVVFGMVLLNVLLWIVFRPNSDNVPQITAQFSGELIGSTAMVLMAIAIILSTKPRILEPYFGGLDKMYQTHKQTAIFAFFLLIGHKLVIPFAKSSFASKRLGNVAYLGIIFLVLITIAPRIPLISRFLNLPYHRWRALHSLLGVLFVVGLAHSLTVNAAMQQSVPGAYMLLVSIIAIVAWLYHSLFGGRRHKVAFTVSQVQQLNGACTEVTLKPKGEMLKFEAGQFVFVQFDGDRHLSEPHPFTVSNAPDEGVLRLSIKGSGDWTRYLINNLKAGADAKVEGAYGMFNYKTGGDQQIWIAGGIGVTPFLSWMRDAGGSLSKDVDFFYGVRGTGDALFWDEIATAAEQDARFEAHLQLSSRDGHLSAEKIAKRTRGNIAEKHIYMCGPVKMTEGFARAFQQLGVPSSNIHYEEFNFR
ncbi:MAG: ferredoxin reductase family protein [Candidatus Promineifilaceae bacterium]